MDCDIQLFGKLTAVINNFLCFSKAMNDHSATITIAISILGAIYAWLLYRHRTKRKLEVYVSLNRDTPSLKEGEEVNSEIWDVFLINPRYHKVHVKEVGLLYRDCCLGKSKKFCISNERLEIEPGDGMFVRWRSVRNIVSCPREISGAYAIDGTRKEWRVRKRLKVKEQ